MVKFTPIYQRILEQDRYKGEIVSADCAAVSNAGKPMIRLFVLVTHHSDGSCNIVQACFPLEDKMKYKLLQFCRVIGIENKYKSGELNDEDFIGKQMLVDIVEILWQGKKTNNITEFYELLGAIVRTASNKANEPTPLGSSISPAWPKFDENGNIISTTETNATEMQENSASLSLADNNENPDGIPF